MAFARAFIKVTHVMYGHTIVRVEQIVAVHEADQRGWSQITLATGKWFTVEEPYPVVCALIQKALEP